LRLDRVGLVALVLLLPAAAFAQTQAPTARLDVDANPACSSRDELVARVAARSTRIRFVNDAAGVPALVSEHRYPADRTTFEIEFSLRAGALQHA